MKARGLRSSDPVFKRGRRTGMDIMLIAQDPQWRNQYIAYVAFRAMRSEIFPTQNPGAQYVPIDV